MLLPHPEPEAIQARLKEFSTGQKREPRVIADLGCGSGNFLVQLAAAHPEDFFLGFELRYKRLVKGALKLERQGSDNVLLLRELGERYMDYLAPASLDVLHVNFPDPWPKSRQWKKRLVSQSFLENLVPVLKPGGSFRLKTDHSGYFLHVFSLIRGFSGLTLNAWSNDLNRSNLLSGGPKTEFELLFRSKHKAIYYLELIKPITDA